MLPLRNFIFHSTFQLLLWLPACLWCQSLSSLVRDADEAYQKKEYHKAHELYQSAIEKEADDHALWFKYAESARQINQYSEAEKYYTRILESQDKFLFGMARFWLGQIKKNLGKYEEAAELFRDFSMLGLDGYYTYWSANEVQICNWAKDQPSSCDYIQIDLLDENINSYYSESGPIEMGNHLYYTSDRSIFSEDKHEPKRHLAKMMVSKNLERGRPVPNEFSKEGQHVGNTAFSHDWQRMYVPVCEFINDEDMRCEIYFRDQDENGNWMRESTRLPDHINKAGYTTTQPAIGYNPVTKTETLYFVSDRPDGRGNLDLWYCTITKEGFSDPINLWEINTQENEVTPSFHEATQTFTFSSNGYRSFGGYDIFYCEKFGNEWDMAINMGMPINSSYDDLYFSKNTTGNRAYFSSNRPGSLTPRSKYEGFSLDIYRVYYKMGE